MHQQYVLVEELFGSAEPVELPTEDDGTLALTTLHAQYPTAIGLVYRTENNALRGLRVKSGYLVPPLDGWGERKYNVTLRNAMVIQAPIAPEVSSTSHVCDETESNSMEDEPPTYYSDDHNGQVEPRKEDVHASVDHIFPPELKGDDIGSDHASYLAKYVNSFKRKLSEIAMRNKWTFPIYESVAVDGGFSSSVIINRTEYRGKVYRTRRNAEQSAAKVAIYDLKYPEAVDKGVTTIDGDGEEFPDDTEDDSKNPIRIDIYNLPRKLTLDEFRTYFGQFGDVAWCQVDIAKSAKMYNCIGHGVVYMKDEADTDTVLSMRRQHRLGSNNLNVWLCDTKTPPDELFVYNIGEITTLQFREYFERFGEIKKCEVKPPQKEIIYGVVQFTKNETIESVIAQRTFINGRECRLERKREKKRGKKDREAPVINKSNVTDPVVNKTNVSTEAKLKLYNIPPNATYFHLKNYFQSFGEVTELELDTGKTGKKGKNTGYGMITFKDKDVTETVLATKEHKFMHHTISVQLSDPSIDATDVLYMWPLPLPTVRVFEVYCKRFGEVLRCDIQVFKHSKFGSVQFKDDEATKAMVAYKHVINGDGIKITRRQGFHDHFPHDTHHNDEDVAEQSTSTIQPTAVIQPTVVNEVVLTDSTKLNIYDLPRNTRNTDVRMYFESFGQVTKCWVAMGKCGHQRYCQGYGYVCFKDKVVAETVVNMKEHLLGPESSLSVQLVDSSNDTPDVILMLDIPFSTSQEFEEYCKLFGEVLRCNVRSLNNSMKGYVQFKDNEAIESMLTQNHIISGHACTTIRRLARGKFDNPSLVDEDAIYEIRDKVMSRQEKKRVLRSRYRYKRGSWKKNNPANSLKNVKAPIEVMELEDESDTDHGSDYGTIHATQGIGWL